MFHVVRADDLAVQDRTGEAGCHCFDLRDQAVGIGVQLLVVGFGGPRARDPLREHRHHVLAIGRQCAIKDGWNADIGKRCGRGASGDRVLKCVLHVIEAGGQHDRAAMDVGVEPGRGTELGKSVEREVDLHRSAARLPSFDVVHEIVGEFRRVELLKKRDLRMRGGDDAVGADLFAGGGDHTARFAVMHENASDVHVRANGGTERQRGIA